MINHHFFIFILFLIYISGMTGFMIWQGIGIAPDRYAFVLLLGSLLVKRTRKFLFDWIPFLFILISYDFLRGFAPYLNSRVHYIELINADILIFGQLPTITLQKLFYSSTNLSWYDFAATIFYFLHFALPLAFGFLLWINSKSRFREFTLGILLLSYAGWISFVAFPAAPPWLAEQNGYISGTSKILDQTLNLFPERISLPTIYHQMNPNPVAAIPSMHAAYPFLVLLLSLSYFRLKGLIFLPYVLAVWISMVYLGEHYVVDILAGTLYATIFFIVAKLIMLRVKFLHG